MTYENETYIENYSSVKVTKRPKLLIFLLLLSSIYIISSFVTVTQKLVTGPLTHYELEQELTTLYSTPAILKANGYDDVAIQNIQLLAENDRYVNNETFYMTNVSLMATLFIGFIGLFLLFKMRKYGLYIYLIYSFLPIAMIYLSTPEALIINSSVILIAVCSLFFALLYKVSLWLAEDI